MPTNMQKVYSNAFVLKLPQQNSVSVFNTNIKQLNSFFEHNEKLRHCDCLFAVACLNFVYDIKYLFRSDIDSNPQVFGLENDLRELKSQVSNYSSQLMDIKKEINHLKQSNSNSQFQISSYAHKNDIFMNEIIENNIKLPGVTMNRQNSNYIGMIDWQITIYLQK